MGSKKGLQSSIIRAILILEIEKVVKRCLWELLSTPIEAISPVYGVPTSYPWVFPSIVDVGSNWRSLWEQHDGSPGSLRCK
jgi:hypothetical protein